MESDIQSIQENIKLVQDRIRKAAISVNRDPDDIELIAVTKEKSAIIVKTLFENGIRKIGESFLNEALFKIELLKDYSIEWHMIGTIQSGKAKQIVQHFNQIHSIDRVDLARKLHKLAEKYDRSLSVYLECNVSGENTKHGWAAWEDKQWELLLPEIEDIMDMGSLNIKGLMTMAPYSINPEDSRPYFQRLRMLQDFLDKRYPGKGFSGLSMGMSGDFEVAIQEGASAVRIGSALVGHR
jgi:hypothetical protein